MAALERVKGVLGVSGFLFNTRSKVVHADDCPMRGRSRRLHLPPHSPPERAALERWLAENPDVRVDPQCLGRADREDVA